ncbi:peptidoglycan DD-metalloendopeptidase family protein [Brachybacterium sp. GPGPB12]|uniref:peptidoglycan DD-metalloendopeptidase family protein n=1 Tax=Brachybacterium sp. GPGPB12 TaxID=3023517 RepID=UPI003134581B
MVAGSPVIATAAIGLIPTIQGVRGNIAGQLSGSGMASEADKAGRSIGSRFSSSVMSTVKTGLKLGGIIGGAVAGVTLKGGFDRALGIEDARAKMSGLGHDTKTVEKIMGNALASVEGTAFGLDAAATTAAGAVAAGIKPGERLEKTLSTVANTAAAAGSGMDEIGGIFNTVAAVGSAYTGDINMIAQRGIPIWQSLGTTLGKSQEEVKKMATEGKIDFATFEVAAADAAGGVATAMGDTTRGSFANMMAAVRKLGAMFATGVLPLAKTTFQGIQGLLNAVKAKLEPFVEGFFDRFGGGAQAGIQSFFDGLIASVEAFDPTPILNFFSEVQGGIRAFGGAWAANDGDITSAGFPGFMERVAYIARTTFDELKGGITAFGAAWRYNDGEITSSGFPGFMERAGYFVRQLWDSMKRLDFSSFSGFMGSLGAVDLSGAASSLSGIGTGLAAMGSAAPGVLSIAIQSIGNAMQFLSDHADTVVKLMPLIVAGFAAWKLHSAATTDALIAQRSMTAAMSPVMLTNNALILTNNLLEGRAARAKVLSTAATNTQATATTRATLAERARTIATKAGAIASKTAAVATRLLGAAIRFATGPIGLIITGVTSLVGALVWFFTKTETGKAIWESVWTAIRNAAAAVVDWFTGTALPYLQVAWDGIAAGALWLYNSAILPAWNGIRAAIGVVGDWITGTLWPAIQTAWDAIGAAAMWLWQNVITPAWNGIKLAIAIVVTAVLGYIDLMKFYFQNVIAPVALWLWRNVITPAWNGIKAAIGAVANWIVNTAWPLIKRAWDAIAGATRWLYRSVILPVWNAIKAAINAVVQWLVNTAWPVVKKVIDWYAAGFKWLYNSVILPVWNGIKGAINAVVQWFKNTAWPLINTVIGWLKMSFEGWKLIAQTVWSAIKSAIKAVSDWLKGTLWPAIKNVIEKLKTGFNNMRDSIKNAWKYVQDKAIQPVVSWLTGTVKPKIDTLTDNIKNAFSTMKDSVLKAWGKIKEGMKSPINGIIRIYNKHIKGNFDNVAGKLGLDTKLPEMSEFATGGYTGPGSKYTPAGIVHADEYVIRKESQNDLRRNAPGFLDSLNRYGARALGYAKGGLVKLRSPFAGSYPRGDGFGARGGRHKGIDWPMPSGAVLKAVGAGSVRHTRNAAAGNKLELVLGNGLVAGYHHLSQFIAKNGSSVGSGAAVGRVGSTGRSSGPHLHFSLKRDGKYVDPAPYLGGGGSAGSGDGGGWWNPFDGLWSKIKGEVSEAVGGGWIGDVLTKTASNTVGWAKDWVFDKIGEVGDAVVETGKTVAGVVGVTARWGPLATKALAMTGDMNPMNHASMMRRMNQESGGNARAVNNWDSNARKGTPSKGLMQVIPPTFRAYAHPEYNKDIFDPLSNMLASIRYTKAAYGSVRRGWDRKGGYADGGWTGPGSKYQPAGVVHADEFVVQKSSRRSIESARPGSLDALNRYGARALVGYAAGGLVGYAAGGKVSPNAKIGSSKVTVILDGLLGTEKQVKTAAGKLADGIAKTFQDRFKANQKQTVDKLADSLKALKNQASRLNKTVNAKTSSAKKSTVNRLSDDLADLRKKAKALDSKKQAKRLAQVRKQIESTQSALTKARRGDYSGAASATAAKLKDVQKQIASTEAALKQARRGNTSAAATKAADAFFTKYASSATTKSQNLAKQSDTLTAKLKNAKAALTEATKVRDDYASSLTEKFAGGYALTAESATTGIETIIRGFRNSAATVKTFTGRLSEPQSKGLSKGLIDQIAQLGVADGSKVAKNLLSGSDSQIKAITKQYNALNSASSKSGTVLGRQMHQAGVDSAKGLVRGLESQLKNVEKASENLANKVISTVRSKLKIKSPSRVMRALGGFTGEGFQVGVEGMVPAVRRSLESLVTPPDLAGLRDVGRADVRPQVPQVPVSAYAGADAEGRPAIQINGGVHGYSAEDIAREIEKRQKRQMALYA